MYACQDPHLVDGVRALLLAQVVNSDLLQGVVLVIGLTLDMIDARIGARAQLLDNIEVVDSRLALLIKPLLDVSFLSFVRTLLLLGGLFDGLLRCFHLSLLLLSLVCRGDRGGCRASAGQVFLLLLLPLDMMWTWGRQLLGFLFPLGV